MATMFVRHKVSDFAAWKQVYDEVEDLRQSGGVTAHAVYQASDDPNDVTVTHDFASVDAARQFGQSKDLRDAMQRAGLAGEPTIWFTERV